MMMSSQCYAVVHDDNDDMMLMSSQCYAVVHDRVFVVADAKVLYNQPAHLAITESCGDLDDDDDDDIKMMITMIMMIIIMMVVMMMICSRSCQSLQFPALGPLLCTWAQMNMIYYMILYVSYCILYSWQDLGSVI